MKPVNDEEIDEILKRGAPPAMDPALLRRVSASMGATLRPVRPMAPAWVLASLLLLISAGIAFLGGAALGVAGIQKMSGTQMGAIFPMLGIFIWLAALLSIAEMTPGGFRWKNPALMEPVMRNPAMLLLAIMTGWIAIDAMLFHDFGMGSFVAEGIPCLRAGVVVAIPTAGAVWLVLRRGFAVNAPAAGLAAGTLAGLAGLTMLEIHCANFHAMHVMVWHTAVLPVTGLAGALLARLAVSRGD